MSSSLSYFNPWTGISLASDPVLFFFRINLWHQFTPLSRNASQVLVRHFKWNSSQASRYRVGEDWAELGGEGQGGGGGVQVDTSEIT